MSGRKAVDQWEDHTVERVEGDVDSGGWTLYLDDGACFGVSAEHGVEPKAGDVARMYGRGFGYPVRGLDLDGVEVFYETEAEHRERMRREQDARDAEKKAEWESRRDEMDRELAALPMPFRMRVCRFRHHNPDFGWEYEGYEMASCVDAVRIAEALDDVDEIETFYHLPWEEQKKVVPDLGDGHSGNTFGMAVQLARHYMTDPDLVWMEHAAISALVGCDDAGCPPVRNTEAERATYESLAARLLTARESEAS